MVEELKRLEAAAHKGREGARGAAHGGGDDWLLDLVAEVSRQPARRGDARLAARARTSGFDSLMLTELAVGARGGGRIGAAPTDDLAERPDRGRALRGSSSAAAHRSEAERGARPAAGATQDRAEARRDPGAGAGRRAGPAARCSTLAQRALYGERLRDATSRARPTSRSDRNFLVVANHVEPPRHGPGEGGARRAGRAPGRARGPRLLLRHSAQAGLLRELHQPHPHGPLRLPPRVACGPPCEALRHGYNLLIFPEGTRSRDGKLRAFKPTAGYLALTCGVDMLPVYVKGTHEALPKGALLPRRAKLEVVIGQPIRIEDLRERTAGPPQGRGPQGRDRRHGGRRPRPREDCLPRPRTRPRSTSRPATSSPAPGGGSGGGAPTPFAAKAPGGSG